MIQLRVHTGLPVDCLAIKERAVLFRYVKKLCNSQAYLFFIFFICSNLCLLMAEQKMMSGVEWNKKSKGVLGKDKRE